MIFEDFSRKINLKLSEKRSYYPDFFHNATVTKFVTDRNERTPKSELKIQCNVANDQKLGQLLAVTFSLHHFRHAGNF